MDHSDHVMLLRDGVTSSGTWADLGSGTGAYTLALADLSGLQGVIYQVDVVIDVSDQIESKWSALLCHATQFGLDNFCRVTQIQCLEGST